MGSGFCVPGAGSPLSTSSWISLAAFAHINQLLSPPLKLSFWSEGVEHWREQEALGGDGAQIPPTQSPSLTANIPGRFSSTGTQLERPPSSTRTLTGLGPPTSASLWGVTNPQGSRAMSSPRGVLSHLCHFVPGKRLQHLPTPGGCLAISVGTRFHLAGLWCQSSAFPAPGHREAALVQGCRSEGCSGPAPSMSDRGIKGKPMR